MMQNTLGTSFDSQKMEAEKYEAWLLSRHLKMFSSTGPLSPGTFLVDLTF
jgi:hypothetical protein